MGLIVLDMIMPIMDGIATVCREPARKAPVRTSTYAHHDADGTSTTSNRSRAAFEAGATDFIHEADQLGQIFGQRMLYMMRAERARSSQLEHSARRRRSSRRTA